MHPTRSNAVITGGGGGLGSAIAAGFNAAEWTVEAPGSAGLDVRNPVAVRRFFRHRKPDLLVCAAGITRDAPLARLGTDAWDEVWRVNYRGALACAAAAIPGMAARGAGHVVFISSHSAVLPPPGQAAYAASKAALLGLTRDLAARHGPDNIRVNAILPGFLETPMTAKITPARRAEVIAAHALDRLNTCDRVAAFIRFLHHQLPHTSGQVFRLDSRFPA